MMYCKDCKWDFDTNAGDPVPLTCKDCGGDSFIVDEKDVAEYLGHNTKAQLTEYICPICITGWNPKTDKLKFDFIGWNDLIEHEGCPDCLSECERCGMIKDHQGSFEHCL